MIPTFLARDAFPLDFFADVDRLQRELGSLLDTRSSIRGPATGAFPALNVGTTPTSVEVYAFAPGLDPAQIDLHIERGVLTLDAERREADARDGTPSGGSAASTRHVKERFAGRFRRVVSLPDDIDPASVQARYRDGVLQVSIRRREAAAPRRIDIA